MVTDRLARFAAALEAADLPEAIRHAAARNLLNVIACALGGCGDSALVALRGALLPLAGAPGATVIGACRADAATAAFLNAASANVQDFDDQHLPTVMHPGPVIVAAAFAAAEMEGADGPTLLAAIAAGLEAGCRIGNAVTPGHYAAGFHITATCGVFGAAVAAARVLRLDAPGMAAAIAHAASQSAGVVEALGAATKSTGVGAAARAGLHAALFARAGLAGPAAPLEGRFGFLNVFCAEPVPARITDGLGERWDLVRSAPKAWPVGVVLHPVVDACLVLRATEGFEPAALRGLVFRGHPLLRLRADRPDVGTGREATVSIQHVAAAAILRGGIGPAELTDACVGDPAIRRLRALVRVEDDEAVAVEGVRLVADFADGREQHVAIACGRGLPDRPLTDAELAAKARLLIGWGAPWCDAEAVIARAWQAHGLPGLAPLSALLVPPG